MLIITTDGHIETRQLKASDQYFSLALIQTQRPTGSGASEPAQVHSNDNNIRVQTQGLLSGLDGPT